MRSDPRDIFTGLEHMIQTALTSTTSRVYGRLQAKLQTVESVQPIYKLDEESIDNCELLPFKYKKYK